MSLCLATTKGKNPRWPVGCTLEAGHLGPHVAHGPGGVVVKRWGNFEKRDMQKKGKTS